MDQNKKKGVWKHPNNNNNNKNNVNNRHNSGSDPKQLIEFMAKRFVEHAGVIMQMSLQWPISPPSRPSRRFFRLCRPPEWTQSARVFFLISSVSLPYVKAQESMRHAFIH